ncbi:MAG: hypothetical protein ABEI31_01915 [Halodesulfurarchaeum sp.]
MVVDPYDGRVDELGAEIREFYEGTSKAATIVEYGPEEIDDETPSRQFTELTQVPDQLEAPKTAREAVRPIVRAEARFLAMRLEAARRTAAIHTESLEAPDADALRELFATIVAAGTLIVPATPDRVERFRAADVVTSGTVETTPPVDLELWPPALFPDAEVGFLLSEREVGVHRKRAEAIQNSLTVREIERGYLAGRETPILAHLVDYRREPGLWIFCQTEVSDVQGLRTLYATGVRFAF